MSLLLLDHDEVPPSENRRDTCCSRTCKRVQHDAPDLGKRFDERGNGDDRLLIRMQFVSGVFPRQHVADRFRRSRRIPLREQVADLVVACRVTLARAVGFRPGQMAHRPETGFPPSRHEAVHPRPAVKSGAKGVGLKNAIHSPKGRLNPGIVVVAAAPPSIAGSVVYKIRRVGDDDVDAVARHRPHDGDAIAEDDLAQKGADGLGRRLWCAGRMGKHGRLKFRAFHVGTDPLKGTSGNQAQHQKIVAAKARRAFPFLAILVGALEGYIEHRAFVGFLAPDARADDAVADVVDGLIGRIPRGRPISRGRRSIVKQWWR
jgi:hypothetical protein